jgi:predicted amino acid racemase
LPYNGGVRKNCVLGFGELISPHIGLSCISDSIDFVGSTHNHTVADFTNAKKTWLVGDFVDFIGNYNCIAHIMISPFVEKVIV